MNNILSKNVVEVGNHCKVLVGSYNSKSNELLDLTKLPIDQREHILNLLVGEFRMRKDIAFVSDEMAQMIDAQILKGIEVLI